MKQVGILSFIKRQRLRKLKQRGRLGLRHWLGDRRHHLTLSNWRSCPPRSWRPCRSGWYCRLGAVVSLIDLITHPACDHRIWKEDKQKKSSSCLACVPSLSLCGFLVCARYPFLFIIRIHQNQNPDITCHVRIREHFRNTPTPTLFG